MEVNVEIIKSRIIELCKINKININTLAKKSGITQSTIDSILKGKSNNPKLLTVITLASYFNVSLDYLTGRTDNPEINK